MTRGTARANGGRLQTQRSPRPGADLISYRVKGGHKVVSQRTEINIGRAVKDKDSSADVALKPGDVLTIHQLSG